MVDEMPRRSLQFYLSMRDTPSSIDKLACKRLSRCVERRRGDFHRGRASGRRSQAYPDSMKIYKVSGGSLIELANYPFDMQRFKSICSKEQRISVHRATAPLDARPNVKRWLEAELSTSA
jgi:hypothetical protein